MLMETSHSAGGEEFTGSPRGANTVKIQDGVKFYRQLRSDPQLRDEIHRLSESKKKDTLAEDEEAWRDAIRHELEQELNRRVREALESPSGECTGSSADSRRGRRGADPDDLDSLSPDERLGDLTLRERNYLRSSRWKVIQAKRRIRRLMSQSQVGFSRNVPDETEISDQFAYPRGAGYYPQSDDVTGRGLSLDLYGFSSLDVGVKSHEHYARVSAKAAGNFGSLSTAERHEFFYAFTKNGFREALRTGRLPDGSDVTDLSEGRFVDKYGIVRDTHGPFWPADFGPLFPTPVHNRIVSSVQEALSGAENGDVHSQTVDTQPTVYTSKWRGVQIVFDSERSPRDVQPPPVSEGTCPSLTFESRFESGNLRQARRVGQFEYELVLQTDLYTARHTQWYYFRLQNALPGVTYKFKIVNLLKKDSLYNYGMKPVLYSEKDARLKKLGWVRSGHHIGYSRNTTCLHCPLLQRERSYYMLEWQMEFPNADDTYYLAHCYPYTFTDLKDDLDSLLTDPERSKVMKREVMCETRAGNSCFLVTVTNFNQEDSGYKKKAVVVSARVHPGETNSSWMMKGLLDFITGSSKTAKELRNKLVFKIVPMLNPDGVIVGNYRCSLAARDLNRNYRHPRKDTFPTIWYTKTMMEDLARRNEIMVYCDLHGHSRKHNVFMYGCGSAQVGMCEPGTDSSETEAYLKERLFPWLMAQKSPEKFWFRGCKFHVKKCKESTGRVVMYRQMKILNSFTMEATFSGTSICRGERRHFSMIDFQHMGQVFSEVVLDYYHVQQNKTRQSEVILELTRAITQQVLESRGVLPKGLPDFTTEAGLEALKEYSPDGSLSSSEQIAVAFMNLLRNDKTCSQENESSRKSTLTGVSQVHLDMLMDTVSGKTIDGCVEILEHLHVAESRESDSETSDSDSESEPELKLTEKKQRRKKKKHRKSKSECQKDPKDRRKDSGDRPRSASGLPAIHTADHERRKTQQHGSMGKYVKTFAKTYPGFVNKYSGRSNGGIPCFSEERLIERAAKRMAEMKKRMNEEQQKREEAASFHAGVTEEEYQKAYTAALNSVESDLSHGHVYAETCTPKPAPVHIRTGYMHGEQSPPHDAVSSHGNLSSDSEPEETEDVATRGVPLSALNSPYQAASGSLSQQPVHMPIGSSHSAMPTPRNSQSMFNRYKLPPMRSKYGLPPNDSNTPFPPKFAVSNVHISPVVTRPGQGVNLQSGTDRTKKQISGRETKDHIGVSSQPDMPHFLSRQYTDLLMARLASHHQANGGAAHSSFGLGQGHRF